PSPPLLPYTTLFRSGLSRPPRLPRSPRERGPFGDPAQGRRVLLAEPVDDLGDRLDRPDGLQALARGPHVLPPFDRRAARGVVLRDRKSTRLNSSHVK